MKSRLHKQKVKEKEKNVNLWQNRKEKCGRTLRTFNKQHLYSMVCFFFFFHDHSSPRSFYSVLHVNKKEGIQEEGWVIRRCE